MIRTLSLCGTFGRIFSFNALITLRTKRTQAHKSLWITPQLKKRMAIRSGNACDWLIFKKCRNAVNNEIKQAKEQYFKSALRENDLSDN